MSEGKYSERLKHLYSTKDGMSKQQFFIDLMDYLHTLEQRVSSLEYGGYVKYKDDTTDHTASQKGVPGSDE